MTNSGRQMEVDQLTQRELEILRLIADGLSNQEIAEQLVITLGTAKWHVKQIFSKLDVSSRTQAIVVARARGLFDAKPDAAPTPTRASTPKHNLPTQATPFIGRHEELSEIDRLLDDSACRLLTLVGAGGIGKTRLSLKTAADHVDDYPDGVWFISLVSVSGAHILVPTILNALNLSNFRQDDPQTQLFDYLRGKSLLLVLDNFEHLLDGADLLSEILTHAPDVKILTTSRERLGLQEEWLFQVQGLAFPGRDEREGIEDYEAVKLFLQQARRVQPSFSLAHDVERQAVVQICQLAEGMPLGIELAASWLRAIPSQQIAGQIAQSLDFLTASARNIPERHRSIRSLFEHSWSLLSSAERAVLMKLSIFKGGFTLEAAESVAHASIAVIVALIDKSLVRPERTGRYDMHELLRQFAYEKLSDSGETPTVKQLHLDFYLRLAVEAQPMLEKPEQALWLQRLEEEHPNMREALRWALDSGALELGLRLVAALWLFWFMRGHLTEGRQHFEALLTAARTRGTSSAAYAEALDKAGVLARYQGDFDRATALIAESLSIYRALGDQRGVGNSLANIGFVALHELRYDDARAFYSESLAINRELDNGQGIADSLSHLALMAYYDHEYEEAGRLTEESLAIWRALGDKQGIAWALHRLGNITLSKEGAAGAQPIFAESLAISRELGYQWGFAWCLEDFARIAAANREFEQTLRLLGAAAFLRKVIGLPLSVVEQSEVDRTIAEARASIDVEIANRAWIQGQSMSVESALAAL
jgi:predicted ATPase/DNA-binding CsgD family transcriptional regulator